MSQYPNEATAIILAYKASPKLQKQYRTLGTFVSACEYHNNPRLQEEFRSFEVYDAYKKAETGGKARILGIYG